MTIEYAHRMRILILCREEIPDIPITGPSVSAPPSRGNEWWENYMPYIAETATIPDQYSWHLLDTSRNLRESRDQFNSFREENNLPERPININEYAWNDDGEQSPAGAVFYLSQLERYNAHGLRANWGSGPLLQDLLANLVVNENGTYKPTGEWHVYNYYVTEMKGSRLATMASEDELFEVYATAEDSYDTTKILAAVRPIAGIKEYDITVTGLRERGLAGDKVNVKTWKFEGPDIDTAVERPVDLGIVEHSVVDDKVSCPICGYCLFNADRNRSSRSGSARMLPQQPMLSRSSSSDLRIKRFMYCHVAHLHFLTSSLKLSLALFSTPAGSR